LGATSIKRNLDNLGDVTITSVTDNEVLAYDNGSSEWINQTAAEAGLSVTGHTHDDRYYTEAEVDALTWDASDIVSGAFADARIAQSNITQHEGAIDHGSIGGLGDDDHTIYTLADGTRAFSGNIDLGTNDITNAGTITGTTLTDGTFSVTGGNFTAVGNITGADVDISAGTGDYTSSGDVTLSGTGVFNSADADIAHTLGRVKIGYRGLGSDGAAFMHRDMAGAYYALLQNSDGTTYYNSGAGKMCYFAAGGTSVMNIHSTRMRLLKRLEIKDGETIGTYGNQDTIAFTDTEITVNLPVFATGLKSGANQGAAGAAADELWHDTTDDTVKMGV